MIPFTRMFLMLLASWAVLPLMAKADNDTNLARASGAAPFGSGSVGPFLISKINDGRLDTMGMWSNDGSPGSFGGVKLGDTPVTFNAIRLYLFNPRADFTGWRLEGSNECDIDEDSMAGTFYDPQLIATDAETHFTNAASKENNVVTITFSPVSYRFVRLVFVGKSKPIGVPELQIFNRDDNITAHATLATAAGLKIDNIAGTLTLPGAISAGELLGKLSKPEGSTLVALDAAGNKANASDVMKTGSCVLAKYSTGGEAAPFNTEYKNYTVIDSTSPPPEKVPYKPSNRPPPPPKPLMSPASVPSAPDGTANLVEGKTIAASIAPKQAADLAKPGDANWFAQQRYPQWFSVDFSSPTTFNFISMRVLGPLSLQHFWIQTSDDGKTWKNLMEVDHVRKNMLWNGYFEKTTARYVRAVLLPPSGDVHVRKFIVANLEKPLLDNEGKPITPLKTIPGDGPDFSTLPAPAVDDGSPEKPTKQGRKKSRS